ncbi:AglZ/HisF2 family acetamidino modification protein [candidate division KSB1 bacterium]
MFRPRIIPVLLLKNLGLVKSIKFNKYRYIGDPINAVKLFNDLKADELVFLDILASSQTRTISLDFVRKVGDEANMPFAVGGGIRSIKHIRDILISGAEKVVINTYAHENPDFIRQAANEFGCSTIVVSIDVRKKMIGKKKVFVLGGTKDTKRDPVEFAQLMFDNGAGELIINSIDHDGLMNGYDLELVNAISSSVTIPVVAIGGAGSMEDLRNVCKGAHANAAAAGSIFVYHGPRRAVLINYPSQTELKSLFEN